MEMRLYPDLREFYNEGFVEYGSSVNLSFDAIEALIPTAPPLSEPDFEPYHDIDGDITLNITSPEEPEKDYDMAEEPEPDYDIDKPMDDLNFNRSEVKKTKDKVLDFLKHTGDKKDFNIWMKWRKEVNQQLLAVILLRQGHRVHLSSTELHRKPLCRHSEASIVREATGCSWVERRNMNGAEKTRLPGRPYIMYGIPRVRLRSKAK